MKKIIFLNLTLLLATPWFLTVWLSPKILVEIFNFQFSIFNLSNNLAYLTSGEFLFFTGDGRPGYGTGDHGVFLLSFMPLLLTGTYHLLSSQKKRNKFLLWWVLIGLTIAVVFGNAPGLPAALWFLPALSLIAATGFKELTEHKIFFSLNLIWIIYESLRLYHIISVHKPFNV